MEFLIKTLTCSRLANCQRKVRSAAEQGCASGNLPGHVTSRSSCLLLSIQHVKTSKRGKPKTFKTITMFQ
jgi:hypothetical protein